MGNKTPKLSKEELNTLSTKTNFSPQQIRRWHKGFMKDCPSGELSRKQFINIYQDMFPEGKAKAFYEHVFRTFDEDDSGKIDFTEFLQFLVGYGEHSIDSPVSGWEMAISITQAGQPEEKLELAFRLYDIDRNGTIEESEMIEVIKAIYLMTDADPDSMADAPLGRTRDIFNKMDVNNDGVLSKEEFINGCLKDETLFNLLACSNMET